MNFVFTAAEAYPEYPSFYNDFNIVKIIGDGNCFWRSIAYIIYENENDYQLVKKEVLNTIMANETFYEEMLNDKHKGILYDINYTLEERMTIETYIKDHVQKDKCWGGTVLDVHAVMLTYKRPVITYFRQNLEFPWKVQYNDNTLLLGDFVDSVDLTKPIEIYLETVGIPHYDVMVRYPEPIPNDKLMEIFDSLGIAYTMVENELFVGNDVPGGKTKDDDVPGGKTKDDAIPLSDSEPEVISISDPEDEVISISDPEHEVISISDPEPKATSPITVDDLNDVFDMSDGDLQMNDVFDMSDGDLQMALDKQIAWDLYKQLNE